jgi:hypothetical protein
VLIGKYRVDNIVEANITRATGEGLAVPTKNGFPYRERIVEAEFPALSTPKKERKEGLFPPQGFCKGYPEAEFDDCQDSFKTYGDEESP